MMKHIKAKLGNMRKETEWVVYPAAKGDGPVRTTIQSDHRICRFDPATGEGVLSAHQSGGAYFHHLSLGATTITVPPEVIAAALAAQPKTGDRIGPGVVVG